MRVLMISDVYFPRINGVSTSIQTFQRELTALGHEITLIAPEYGPGDETPGWIHRIPSRRVLFDPEDRMMKREPIFALTDVMKQKDFDLIHIQTPFVAHYAGIELSRRLNIPRIETYHTHFEEYLYHYLPWSPRPLTRFVTRWFNRRQCNEMDALVVPSTAMIKVLDDYGIERPVEIIATGLEEGFFTPGDGARFRARYGIHRERPLLVHIGRVAHEKNIDFLLHMLSILVRTMPEVLLVIAGEGPAADHLHNLTRSLKLENNVLFVGYLDRETMLKDCYNAGDAFVFASKTETQGLVLLEAMAQGVPVVSISALGTADILESRRGAVVAAEDIDEFSARTAAVLQDPALRSELGMQAQDFAREWSARAYAVKMASLYETTALNYRLN